MEEKYEINQEETVIDLREGFIFVLRKWRVVFICAIIGAVVFSGVFGGIVIASYMDDEYRASAQASNAAAKKAYKAKIEAQDRIILNLEDQIATQEQYQNSSIMMNLNPYDLYKAERRYFITTDYKILPGNDYQDPDYTASVLSAYENISTMDDLYNFVKDKVKIKKLNARTYDELVLITADYETNFLEVVTYGRTKKMAESLMKYTCRGIWAHEKEIADSVCPHERTLLKDVTLRTFDETIADNQKQVRYELTKLNKQLQKREKAKADKKIKKPHLLPASTPKIVIRIIKWFIIGGIVGFIVACLWFLLRYLFCGIIGGSRMLQTQYKLRFLGRMEPPIEKKIYPPDKWIDMLDSIESIHREPETALQYIAANLQNYISAEKEKKILLVGTEPEYRESMVAEGLSNTIKSPEISPCGDITRNPDALNKVAGDEPVVLVAERYKTRKKELEDEIVVLQNLDKEIKGIVLI